MGEVVVKREVAGGLTEEETERAVELAVRADQGDSNALAELTKVRKGLPAKSSNILKNHVRSRILSGATRDDQHFTRWTLEKDTELLERHLAGPNPSPLESLLAEQAATCFLQLQVANAQAWGPQVYEPFWKRTERCHKMMMETLKVLAYIRKVSVSTLMVNMAEQQQVNVGANNGRV